MVFSQPRPRVFAAGGMVAAAHPLAVAAGIDALRGGGNAVDAAISAAATAAVTLPSRCGLGGDAFFIYYEARTKTWTAVNGSGGAPRALSRDYFVARDYHKMPYYGPLSVSVPGAVDAYFAAISRWCRLPASQLFSYAIHYAQHGYPVSDDTSRAIANVCDEPAKCPTSAEVFLRNGRPPQSGELLVQADLARSLLAIAEGGPEVFYAGQLAERIVAGVREAGGELALEDLAGHTSDVYEPIATEYRGYTVYETTLPSQGHILLEELNILEHVDLAALGHNSAAAIHLMIEAKKCAFADRNAYARDPGFGPTPLGTMLSKPFARTRFERIDPQRANHEIGPGAMPERDGDTTYLCTADAEGNMVSFIQSLSAGFGSQVVAGDTGIVLNNRAGSGFMLEAGHPNVIEGGKRTMHTLNCYAIAKDDEIRYVGGTPGGDQQPQWNMQVITNLIDFGLDVQAAVEAPRWQSLPGAAPLNLADPFEVRVESRLEQPVIEDLRRRGHSVTVLGTYAAGGAAFVIARDSRTGVLQAGADPRSEGFALGI